jgi:tRNA pseudouridine synthase 10
MTGPSEAPPLAQVQLAAAKGLCNACLGRLFRGTEKGQDADARGAALRTAQVAPSAGEGACWLCEGTIADLDSLAKVAQGALEGHEFETMLVGTTVDPVIQRREAEMALLLGVGEVPPLKHEVNRLVGLRLEAQLGKRVDFKDPDIAVHLDARFNTATLQVKSAYFRGRYRKLDRTVPQTRWPCRDCRGKGCKRCNGTGKMYETSVEEIIAVPLMRMLGGDEHALHGAGREDVDALMLGNGRPFIVEIRRPRTRSLDGPAAAEAIAKEARGRVEVDALSPCEKAQVAILKDAGWQKTYRVLVALEKDIKDDQINRACAELTGSVIDQQTPTRVAHRRADKVRKRRATEVRLLSKNGPLVELQITGDSGLYVKELVHGDEGRTEPNFAKLVGVACKVCELDVLAIHET